MKKALLFLLLGVNFISFAQIELEHTYNEGPTTRVKLEYSGEKYYLLKSTTNELVFYNADHTLWKTIVLPAPEPTMFTSTRIFHVSETEINPDANIEVVFGYYNFGAAAYESKVIAENGTVLLTIPNAVSVELSKIPGLPNKLISKNIPSSVSTKVYALPELTLEKNYTGEDVTRVNLENSGEKYYSLKSTTNEALIYNQDHTLWKTLSLPKPSNAVYSNVGIVSETLINADASLEIGYSYYALVGSTYNYESKIVNESNTLLTIPDASQLSFSKINALDNKLMATIAHYDSMQGTVYSSSVYALPTLSLEKAYESIISRIILENSGEKYYTSLRPIDNIVKIYNSDHTLWKSIALPVPSMYHTVESIGLISETKIDSDPLVELSYSYINSMLLEDIWEGQVINENGLVLLTAFAATGLTLSEIPGGHDKIIGQMYYGDSSIGYDNYYTNVYAFDALGIPTTEKQDAVRISPNPATSLINIASKFIIVEATLYNSLGAAVQHHKMTDIHSINVDNLATGMYFLSLLDNNNRQSIHKIMISH